MGTLPKLHMNLSLLEAPSELLDELEVTGTLAALRGSRIAGRIAMLDPGHTESAPERLVAAGHMPGLVGDWAPAKGAGGARPRLRDPMPLDMGRGDGLPPRRTDWLPRLLLAMIDELRHRGDDGRRLREVLVPRLGLGSMPPLLVHGLLDLLWGLATSAGLLVGNEDSRTVEPRAVADLFGAAPTEMVRKLVKAWRDLWLPGAGKVPEPQPHGGAEVRELLKRLSTTNGQRLPWDELRRAFEPMGQESADMAAARCRELAELGVLNPSAYDRGALELTALGSGALGAGVRAEAMPPTPRVIVQPTFEIVVLTREDDLATLELVGRFAAPTGPPPCFSYQLSPASVMAANRTGMATEEIMAWLREASTTELPQNVVHTLDSWVRSSRSTRLYRDVTIVEFPSGEALDQAMPVLELVPNASRVSRTFLLVETSDRDEITRYIGTNSVVALDYRGHLPAFLDMDAQGLVVLDEDRANLMAEDLLDRFTEPAGQGRRRFSAERLAETLERLSPGDLAARVDSAFKQGIPPRLELALTLATARAVPSMFTGTLVHMPSPEAMDALIRDPGLRASVLTRVGPRTALVKDGRAEQLRSGLGAMGFPPSPTPPRATADLDDHGSSVEEVVASAIREGRDLSVTYDPGARRPPTELRVRPVELVTKNQRRYLRCRPHGEHDERLLSLNYVLRVRPVGR